MGRMPKSITQCNSSQKALAEQNIGLVFYWAIKLNKLHPHIQKDDLTGPGFIALCRAAQLFDPSKGKKFESYAGRAIHNEMIRFIRENSWLVHVPTALNKLVWKEFKKSDVIPSQEELGLSDSRYRDFRSAWLIRRTEMVSRHQSYD